MRFPLAIQRAARLVALGFGYRTTGGCFGGNLAVARQHILGSRWIFDPLRFHSFPRKLKKPKDFCNFQSWIERFEMNRMNQILDPEQKDTKLLFSNRKTADIFLIIGISTLQ